MTKAITEASAVLTKAKNRQSNKDDAQFLRWVIGEPKKVFKMDYEKAIMHVAESKATKEDVQLLADLL